MTITTKQIQQLRQELDSTHKPLFFFDDDPDGLSSFLLFYRYVREGRGIVVKAKPILEEMFARKVHDYSPDKVFVLDKPDISDEFIDNVNQKIVWLDHHEPKPNPGVKYFNPMLGNSKNNRPTSYWCYKVVKQDFWIAMTGIVGDWAFPLLAKSFSKKMPDLLPGNVASPNQALYETKIGKLARIFSFVMKGKTQDANKAIKVLTRIDSPYEILDQDSAQGKFVYKRYQKINREYTELIEQAENIAKKSKELLVFIYNDSNMSFTGDLSNELMHKFPGKTIIVGRRKNREMKCSVRSRRKILPVLKRSLKGVEGYGGGHQYACGTCVKEKDWSLFLDNFKKQLN
jgi:hypothetical protein